jgi:NADH-quinone oxidoreductase subunit J
MAAVLWRGFLGFGTAGRSGRGQHRRHQGTGPLIYTKYIYGFEIAAVILLVAIIAAVALTLRKRKDSKAIDPGDAVKRQA